MVNNAVIDRLIKDINISLREFPRTDFPLKQQIQLCKSAATRLRNAEIGIDDTEKAKTGPEEAYEERLADIQMQFAIDTTTYQ